MSDLDNQTTHVDGSGAVETVTEPEKVETLETLLDELVGTPDTEEPEAEDGDLSLANLFEEKEKASADNGDKKPLYDTRVYDEAGKQIGGSVFYEVEKLADSVKPKDDMILKLQSENEMLRKIALEKGKSIEGGDSQTSQLIERIKAKISEEYPDEDAETIAQISQQVIDEYETTSKSDGFLAEIEPKFQAAVEANPDYFIQPDDAAVLLQYNQKTHPDYQKAVNTQQLLNRAQSLGDFDSALRSLVPTKAIDIATLEAQAREKANAELMENLRKRKARLSGVPGAGSVIAAPVKTVDQNAMSPQERDEYRRQGFRNAVGK